MTRKRLVLLIFVLLIMSFSAFAFWTYRELHAPRAHNQSETYIQIPRGSSPTEIISKLTSSGIIGREWPILIYLKFTGASAKLKAGDYRFPSPISPIAVIRKLEEGQERLSKFTVVEGRTRWDIAESIARVADFKLQSKDEALSLMDDVKAISDLDPSAKNLEGYLYPDTYSFPPDTAAPQMVALMVKRFRQEWKPEWSERARTLNMTPRQIVTIASLIETEAKLAEDRPLVSSVIYNRLKINMPLGIDSSIIYASKLAGKWRNDGKVYKSDLDRKSPYNTRLYTGLPPGPVASPGADSLRAALYPATTDYLFYVREPSRNDGAHNFYSNDREFSRGVEALRKWERERDAREAAKRRESQQPTEPQSR